MKNHYQILIIGAGNAGISVAAQLLRKASFDIAIVDSAKHHYYQPAWTLVGAGAFKKEDTIRLQADLIPSGAAWIKNRVTAFNPEQNQVTIDSGELLTYDFMVVAPGIQLNWGAVKGLSESLGKNGICSNYSFEHVNHTWESIRNFKGGKAIFVNPHTPVKCGGAPHKIMYMAADYFRKQGILNKTDIQYWSGAGKLFAVDKYEKTLLKVCERANIKLNFFQRLEEIDATNKRARFVGFGEANKNVESWVDFDMIHVAPPQGAPDVIKTSKLANEAGWVDINKNTLQHNRYTNIFSLGDASSLPTSKTGAAIRKQAPVVVENLIATMEQKNLQGSYSGYTSCPLVTGYGKLVLAEFDYNNQPQETFPFDQSKERWSMYQLKKQVLPWLYWNKILKGTA